MQPLKALVQIRPPMISELELRLPSGDDRRVTTAVLTLGGGGDKRENKQIFLGTCPFSMQENIFGKRIQILKLHEQLAAKTL